MKEEGFSRRDNAAERALYTADAALFGDFTRVVSLREALYAFARGNAGVKGIMDRVRAVLGADDAFRRSTRERTSVGAEAGRMSDTEEDTSAGLGAEADPRFAFTTDPARDASGLRGDANFGTEGNGIRREHVEQLMTREQQEARGGEGGEAGQVLDEGDALQLYSLLAEVATERFEHIRSMSAMVAERLRKLGNPQWSRLTGEQKEEYRDYFYSVRRLVGELKTLLVQLNNGDGQLTRALVSGADWLERKVTTSCDTVRARMAALLGRNDWTLASKMFAVIQFGASVRTPPLPSLGAGAFTAKVGVSAGVSTRVATRHLEDSEKTYASSYHGPVIEITGGFDKGGRRFVAWFKRETRHFHSAHYCIKSFGKAPCRENFSIYFLFFPVNFGRFRASWVPLASRIILMAAPKLASVAVRALADNSINQDLMDRFNGAGLTPPVGAGTNGANGTAPAGPENAPSADDTEDDGMPLTARALFGKLHELLYSISPVVFSPPDSGSFRVNITGPFVVNLLKDMGPAFLLQTLSAKVENQLGIISYVNEYRIGGTPDDPDDSGVDAAFVQLFFEGQLGLGFLKKLASGLDRAVSVTGAAKVKLFGEFGTLFWLVPPGAALRYNGLVAETPREASLAIGQSQSQRATTHARGKISSSTTSSDSSSSTTSDKLDESDGDSMGNNPCDSGLLAERAGTLHRAVESAEATGHAAIKSRALQALAELETFKRSCA
jgi:hypothetical protein